MDPAAGNSNSNGNIPKPPLSIETRKLPTTSSLQDAATENSSTSNRLTLRKYQQMQHQDIKYENDSTFYGSKMGTKASTASDDGKSLRFINMSIFQFYRVFFFIIF